MKHGVGSMVCLVCGKVLRTWGAGSKSMQLQIQQSWSAGTQPNLSMAAMSRLQIAMPSLEDQIETARHIRDQVKTLDSIVLSQERAIVLLREFRDRLVSDIVTGQVTSATLLEALPEDDLEHEQLFEESEESDEFVDMMLTGEPSEVLDDE